MAYKNKADQAAAARRHYEANKEKMVARAKAHREKQMAIIKEYIAQVKDTPCADCGVKYHPWVMEFDHIGSDKVFNIGDYRSLGKTLQKVKEEIAKCEIVCANCHRTRTWMRSEREGQDG